MNDPIDFCGKWITRDGRTIIVEKDSWNSHTDEKGFAHIGQNYFDTYGNYKGDPRLDLMEKIRPAKDIYA